MSKDEPFPRLLGPVTLIVKDLQRSIEFYRDGLGMRLLSTDGPQAKLGAEEHELLTLEEDRSAPRIAHTTGLYHMAILLPTRADLARQLRRMLEAGIQLHGAADHDVSEALYLVDPEGNGIEIYRDRPREQWAYLNQEVRMGSRALDVEDLLATDGAATQEMASGTIIGHVHLRISDLPAAEAFYRNVLGFDVTTRYGREATFLSKFGYHHHLGLNTWSSLGAPLAPVGAAGLKHFVLYADGPAELAAIESKAPEHPTGSGESEILLRDPSGNHVLVVDSKTRRT